MRRKKMIFSIWEVLFAGVLCLVFLIALTGTQYNIAWYKVGFVTVIWLLCLTLLFVMLKKAESWLERYGKILFPLFCGIWAAALYAFSCFARNQPASDFAMVYEGALNYARGTEVYWPYFALWKNNYPLLLLLTSLIRLSDLLGFADPFYLILCLSVAMVIWSGICVFRLVGYAGKSTACQWMGILLFAGFLPCWGGTQNFYTDTMSLCFGIWACLLCQKAFEKAGGYGLAAGVVWGMGCSIKATVAISMAAVFLIVMTAMQWKQWLRLLLPVGAGFLLILGGVLYCGISHPALN